MPALASRLLALLLTLAAPLAAAVETRVDPAELKPSELQQRATQLVTHFLTNYHYKRVPLDDELSAQILKRYLESLDPNRSFFLQADIDGFQTYADRLDDALRDQDLGPAFEVFLGYRARVEERVRYARQLSTQPFDFTLDESYEFDRSKAPWAASPEELDEIWRKRVKNDVLGLQLAGKKPEEIAETLQKRYDSLERATAQLNSDDVFQVFMNAYAASIEPHTAYFSPRSSENFRIRMSLSLEGIGAVLQSDNEYTLVREVVPGGPAGKSGQVDVDDRIVGIAQGLEAPMVDVVGWRLDDVVDLIRGPKDSVVRLQVLPKGVGPEGPMREVVLTRNKIELEEQAAKKLVLDVTNSEGVALRIGVIELGTFYMDFDARARGDKNYRSTTRDVRKLLEQLRGEKVDGIVVDLRGNGGGSLTEATELTGLFIPSGPVVQVRDSTGRIQVDRDPDPAVVYGGPLAVLVDRNSASASEIFAGAIQDYRRGIILGEPTFGKGTVQNLVDLDQFDRAQGGGLGQLKATIAQFFRVAGGSTQHRGVVPDIVFPTAVDSQSQGERALENALPWDEVRAADFRPASAPVDAYSRVRALHEQRMKDDPAAQALIDEARAVREAEARRTVSLLAEARKAEQERVEAEQRDRENRIRMARGMEPLPEPAADAPALSGPGAPGDGAPEPAKEDVDPRLDVLRSEAANVLADLIVATGPKAPTMASSTQK